MHRSARLLSIALMAFFVVAAAATSAEAQRLTPSLNVTQATNNNGLVDATFTVEVTNEEPAAATNVWLVFEDGTEVSVGEVPAEGSAASGTQTHSFDLSGKPQSHNQPLPVTLKFSIEGDPREKQTVVVLRTQ